MTDTSSDPPNMASPFGGAAHHLQTLSSNHIAELYRKRCGADVSECFHGHASVHLYECERTGYRFWRPVTVAGDERLYQLLSGAEPHYYRTERWEYPIARKSVSGADRLLEIGCGRGYFLQSLEGVVHDALGLEFNVEAIQKKVTRFAVMATPVEMLAQERNNEFQAICAFQVLEHIAEPGVFLRAAVALLAPGGRMILSTPNRECIPLTNQEDAFDLPPHHMGHFNASTFHKIAAELGLQVLKIHSEPRKHARETVSDATRHSFIYRATALAATSAYNAAYRICNEPGFNLVAVLQKR